MPPRHAAPHWLGRRHAAATDCDNFAHMLLASADPGSWSFYPGPLLLLLPVTVWFVYRWRAVPAHPARLLSFLLGIGVTLIALYSPIDSLGEEHFTMHMVQHLLLIDVAPILCFLGLTKAIFRPATRRLIQLERARPGSSRPSLASWPTPPACGSGTCPISTMRPSTTAGSMRWSTSRSPSRGASIGGT